MVLGRGRLPKIDRKVFAELSHSNGVQAVKVPVSDAVWSTWRRYCDALGISMGIGVAGLIFDELDSVVDGGSVGEGVFATQVTARAAERTSRLDVRQRELDTVPSVSKRKRSTSGDGSGASGRSEGPAVRSRPVSPVSRSAVTNGVPAARV